MQSVPGVAAIVVMGVSGAGKSTVGQLIAARLDCPFRDADSFHPPANIAKMSSGAPLTDEDRMPWLAAIAHWIDERCGQGEPGIVSCSALKRAYRQRIIGARRRVRLVYLKGDRALIGRRLEARRHHFMPASLLESQFATLEEPRAGEHPVIVNAAMSPRRVVATILERLGLEARPEGS